MSAETEGTGRRADVRARAPSWGVPAGRARAVVALGDACAQRPGRGTRAGRAEQTGRPALGALHPHRPGDSAPPTCTADWDTEAVSAWPSAMRTRTCARPRVHLRSRFSPTRRVMTSCSRGCPRRHAGSACVALCSEGRVQGRWPRRRPGRRAARSPRGRDAAVAAAWGKHVPRFPRRRGDRAPALPPADVSAGGAPVTRQGVLRRKWMLTPSAHGERRPPQVEGSVPRTAPRTRASGAGRQSGLSPVLLTGDKSEAPAPPS